MNLDWARLKVVVLESDDWGFCAWVPDEHAHRILADLPAWRSPAGRVYGRSTLESARDLERLASTLLEFRGADGFPPVWQANTIVAAPDFTKLRPPQFETEPLPLLFFPETPSRWTRPGLWEQVQSAQDAGVWWPELHGLHHIPATAWHKELRRGTADARRALEQQSVVCEATLTSSEYDSSEPEEERTRTFERAVHGFEALFGRRPTSFCAPSYRWDESLDDLALRLGIRAFQGRVEREGRRFGRWSRWIERGRWPEANGSRFVMPPRIAFEPCGRAERAAALGVPGAHRRIRAAWRRGQPAAVSTHRVNYAHLDESWSEAGRAALRQLLDRLMSDGAMFLTDAEVRDLHERGWSVRPIGRRGALVRVHERPARVVFAAPAGVARAVISESRPGDPARVTIEEGEVVAELPPGEHLLEWRPE